MIDKFKNQYKISSIRLPNYDYAANGLYFITICTKNKINYFGKIITNTEHIPILEPTIIGQIAIQYCTDIPLHYPTVEVDEFIVMPNHLHIILSFHNADKIQWTSNKFGPQSKNIPAIIRAYKSSVKRYANQNNLDFEWQPSYHEHIINNPNTYFKIKNYIINNPTTWINDKFYK